MKKLFLFISALVIALAVNASTDFAAPGYYCAADDAALSGTAPANKFFLKTDVDPHTIVWYDVAYGAAVATWNITATRSCYVSVSLDLGSYDSNKHIFEVKILQGSTERGTVAEGAADPSASTDGYKDDYDKVKPLEGSIFLPEAGEYTVELRNIRGYGKGAVKNVILTYAGGAQVNIPAVSIPFSDAIFSTHAWLDKTGTSDSIRFARADHEGEAADASYTVAGSEYVKWNVNVANDGYYKFTANTYCKQGHNYRIMLLSADESSTIHTWQEVEGTGHDHHNEKANWEISTDAWNIPAGNYVLKVQARAYGRLLSIAGTYIGGAVQTLPTTTDNSEAWFSPKGTRADGMISFPTYADQWVKWNIAVPGSVTRAYNVALNINNPTEYGHRFSVSFYEPDAEDPFATLTESSWNQTYGTPLSIPMGIVNLDRGNNYIVKVTNSENGAQPKIISLSFTYAGGNVQNMPCTTSINDAWFSSQGTREDGKIDFPNDYIQDGWVKWNVSFASAANYNVTVNIDNANGHNYTVALYRSESDESPITVSEGGQHSTVGTLDLGVMTVPAGSYILKVTNATKYSDAKLISVTFAYAGGAAVDLSKSTPASLLANADAILSDDWTIEGGKITHAESKALTGWAKWNIDCADYANYNVTVNISSDNGHLVRVEVFEDEAAAPIYTLDETSATQYHTGDQAIDLGNIALDNREYVVKVSNTGAYSHVQIASIVITYQNGARATLPASCTFADLMLSAKAHVTAGNLWFNTIGDSNPVGQWAKWNVKAAAAGTFLFTMNVTSSNSQSYKISILDMDENELDAFESGSLGSGDKEVKHYFNLAAGNYIVKLENTYAWSQGHVVSLEVTDPDPVGIVTLDEAAENNSVIAGHDHDGNHDIQIIRTITGGMYNTICLPFDVNNVQLKNVFGSDVILKQMQSAELEDGTILNLNFEDATSIYRGTPYLIKTSHNVVNPIFAGVEIKATVGQTTSGSKANFIGNFIKGTILASPNNIFLSLNDQVYFPEADKEILGFRAYFVVHDAPSGVIKRARIVQGGQVATEIDLVKVPNTNKAIKTIENGQLIIIRDGVRYNVMGAKLQ